MKYRNGFVSNSSSSSFILQSSKSVLDYAMMMVPCREWETDADLIHHLKSLKKVKEYIRNTPIAFNSCNYWTYIVKLGKYVYIDTCNNHDWTDKINKFIALPDIATVQEALRIDKLLARGILLNVCSFALDGLGIEFYYPELGVIASPCPNFCNKKIDNYDRQCWGEIITIGDMNYCTRCGKIPDSVKVTFKAE
jgi:hypothetical protein